MTPKRKAVFSDFGTVWRCDICGKPRSAGRHASCSRERQRRMARPEEQARSASTGGSL